MPKKERVMATSENHAPSEFDSCDKPDLQNQEALAVIDAMAEDVFDGVDLGGGPPDGFPAGFELQDGWLWIDTPENGWVKVCTHLVARALTRDFSGEAWGVLLELQDPDGQTKRCALLREQIAKGPTGFLRILTSMGLSLDPDRHAKSNLQRFLASVNPQARARTVSRIGWHEEVFVLPERAIYPEDTPEEKVIYQGLTSEDKFQRKGSLHDWQESVGKFCRGNSRLTFAVSTALAAPLLEKAGYEGGGFHFHGGSSIGKTSVLHAAGSVCGGGGVKGFLRSWRGTDNGFELIAEHHCDCPLALDEIGEASRSSIDKVSYMLADGQGKIRRAPFGGTQPTQRWRLLFLSTGEMTIVSKIGHGKVQAGQLVRVVDIPADAGVGLGMFEEIQGHRNGAEFSQAIREAAGQNYGVALPAFVGELVKRDPAELRDEVQRLVSEFVRRNCPEGANGQVTRVCERFGLVAAAGHLATKLGIVPWEESEAEQAAAECFAAWLEGRDDPSVPHETEAGLAQVRKYLEQHGDSRFGKIGETTTRTISSRAGFREKNDDGSHDYFILPEVFTKVICKGFDPRVLCEAMAHNGWLERGRDGKNSKVKHLPGMGSKRVYHIKSVFLQDPEPPQEEQALQAA